MVGFVYIELSTISAFGVEGSLLRYGPSVISSLSVEGSTLGSRTIRDSGPKCGRFGPGEWNQPRNGALAWKVQLLDPEPSVIRAQSVEGSRLDAEPSAI